MRREAIIIGAGFSGLSAALFLSKKGFKIRVVEKNSMPGGRARKLETSGFTFDMGPSWYWLPDVFDRFFHAFSHDPSDFYKLVRLDPSYRVFFTKDDYIDVPANTDQLYDLFETIEKDAAKKLKKYLAEAETKYNLGIKEIVYKPGKNLFEFIDLRILRGIINTHFFSNLSKYVRRKFKDIRLIRILEFPVIFLGAIADKTPSLYSLMNYADLKLGTWYPMGGIYEVVAALEKMAIEQGVEIIYNSNVNQIDVLKNKVNGIVVNNKHLYANYYVASADYHHVDNELLDTNHRNYSEKYWNKRVMAPSALLFYIGINKKIPNLLHHNLFFDTDFEMHSKDIYAKPKWPENPAIYVSCSSKTDPSVAPPGHENLVVLIPVASGLEDHGKVREHYYNLVIERIETITKIPISDHVIFHKSYAHTDFIRDYNAYKGNAYGLANTLMQTAFLRPNLKSKKLSNLFYTGQLTLPGPGVPPALISGEIVSNEIFKQEHSRYS